MKMDLISKELFVGKKDGNFSDNFTIIKVIILSEYIKIGARKW